MMTTTMASSYSIFFVSTIFMCIPLTTCKIFDHHCVNTANYTPNSVFAQNLKLAISHLIAKSNESESNYNLFYSTSTGEGSDSVYGLFNCVKNTSQKLCNSCIKNSSEDIIRLCPNQKEAIIYYDECMLRYTNDRPILARLEEAPQSSDCDPKNVSDPDQVNSAAQALTSLRDNILKRVADFGRTFPIGYPYSNYYAYLGKRYGLSAECTQDTTKSDCYTCLSRAAWDIRTPQFCSGSPAGRIHKPSCYLRFYSSDFVEYIPHPVTGNAAGRIIIIVVPTILVSTILLLVALYFYYVRWKKCNILKDQKGKMKTRISKFVHLCSYFASPKPWKKAWTKAWNIYNFIKLMNVANGITNAQSLQFELGIIEAATNKFSADNKIGEGGFGSVYMGELKDGQQIAVKRLARGSRQGELEFKNEVELVAKLQHRNLVRLLGFCIGRQEKILVYEFVPNKSLDYFIFDSERQAQLDWSRRHNIILGIARGMLYLHEDSGLRIIHRDLKASNVLLDENMNPKISDFGMARILGVDQTRGNTKRVVGTYGYMSPEYVMRGHFSVKSDVFSFGILILEIITGKMNSSLCQSEYVRDLPSYAWKCWRDGKPLELLDPTLTDSYLEDEVVKCIHIGLLCIQKDPAKRPTMASLVLMLNSFLVTLPLPHQPTFFFYTSTDSNISMRKSQSYMSTRRSTSRSTNQVPNTTYHSLDIVGSDDDKH